MKLLPLFPDDQINLFKVTSVFMKAFTLILWWSDKPVSSTSVFMKLLLLFYDDQINLFQVLVLFMKHLLLFHDDQMNLFQILFVHESFTLILWWSDKPVSNNSVFMKCLPLFYDDQINQLQVLGCSWNFYPYFMMIR